MDTFFQSSVFPAFKRFFRAFVERIHSIFPGVESPLVFAKTSVHHKEYEALSIRKKSRVVLAIFLVFGALLILYIPSAFAQGFEVRPGSLTIDEGERATFDLRLTTPPSHIVNVKFSVPDSISPFPLTPYPRLLPSRFSGIQIGAAGQSGGHRWNEWTTLTVLADHDDDVNHENFAITIRASSSDSGYNGKTSHVNITIIDDDFVKVTPRRTLEIDEGSSGSFNVSLGIVPSANVTVELIKTNSDITLSPTLLTFTPTNSKTEQSVTVSASHDNDNTNDTDTITLIARGPITTFETTVSVTVTDDDIPRFFVDPTSLTITEGGQATFRVRPATRPSANMTVNLSAPGSSLTINPTTLDFYRWGSDHGNAWNQYKTVTVSEPQDDDSADERAVINIRGAGGDYQDRTSQVNVSVEDDDTPGFDVKEDSLTIIEGGQATFEVRLTTSPSDRVLVSFAAHHSDITLDTDSGASGNQNTITFINYNQARAIGRVYWNQYQRVTLTAGHDDDMDNESFGVTLSTTISRDDGYKGKSANINNITLTDDDVIVIPSGTLEIGEGGSKSFNVSLNTSPSSNVTISLAKTNSDITLSPTSLTFTTENYSTAQSVTVSAGEDADIAHDSDTITLTASGGYLTDEDETYASPVTKSVAVTDDDIPRFFVDPTSLTIAEGGQATFRVRPATRPSANMTVNLSAPGSSLTIDPTTLRFDRDGEDYPWDEYKTVTVSEPQDGDSADERSLINIRGVGGDYQDKTSQVNVSVEDDDIPGFVVTPTSLTIAEGGQATFKVRLATSPSDRVLVSLAAHNSDTTLDTDPGASGNQNTITFINYSQPLVVGRSYWNQYRTVTLSAGHDADFNDESFGVTISTTISRDDAYKGKSAGVSITITDDDELIQIIPKERLEIGEGGSGTFNVRLGAAPDSNITVSLAKTNSDITLSPTALTFTPTNYSNEQTVTVTASEDADLAHDSDTITLSASGEINAPAVTKSVLVFDNDSNSGIFVDPDSLTIAEGGQATFRVRLTTSPSDNVLISFSVPDSDTTLDTNPNASGNQTTFTFINNSQSPTIGRAYWNQYQTVTVFAGHDADVNDESFVISLDTTTRDNTYRGKRASVDIAITDDDKPLGTIQITSGTLTIDEGGSGTFDVSLSTAPGSNVTVSLAKTNSDITLLPTSLTFTPENYSTAQTVTVSAGEDTDIVNESDTLTLSASGGINAPPVTKSVSITDNDAPSGTIVLSDTQTLTIDEGGSGTFDVSLSAAPNANVTVSLAKTNSDITLSPTSLTFDASNYGTGQTITVSAAEDTDATNDSDTITLSATGGIDADDVTKSVSVTDNDTPSEAIVLSDTNTLNITEGGSGTFSVSLSAAPSASGTVSLTKTNADITLFPTSLTFDASNYGTGQTITVTAAEDADSTNESDTIILTATGGISASPVTKSVSVSDNDAPPGTIVLSDTRTLNIAEGGSGTFDVTLSAAPNANVTVSLEKTNADITLSPTSLTFDASNYRAGQRVTVSAAEDADNTNDSDTITLSATGGIDADDVTKSVSVTDNDAPSGTIVLSDTNTLNITEGGSGTFRVSLSTAPSDDVRVSLSKTNSDITLSPTSLIFTSDDYAIVRSVLVSAKEDDDATDDTDTITLVASGGIDAPEATKSLSVTDNDEKPSGSIVLDPSGTLTIDEGGSGTLSVSLSAAPNADVTVSLRKTNADITLDRTSLTFDASNYATPQDISVSAAEDEDATDDSDAITLSADGGIIASDATSVISVNDDEVVGSIVLDSTETLNVDEGGYREFTVRLSTAPNNDVKVSLGKTNADVTLSPASLTFTASNYRTAQTVTLTAAQDDDAEDDSDIITIEAAGGFIASDVTKVVSVDDDEVAGSIILSPTTTLEIAEGDSAAFSVSLSIAPVNDVSVNLSKTNDDIGLSTTSLTFTASDWETPQSVTVSAAQDDDAASESDTITLSATGGIVADAVIKSVRVADDDAPSGTISTDPATLSLNEGESTNLTVRLLDPPIADVTVSLLTTGEALVLDKTSLVLPVSNWSAAQTVTVSAAHDPDTADGSHTITLSASGGIDASDVVVSVSVADDDFPGGLSLSPSPSETLEVLEGGSATLGISLTARPSVASVSVLLSKSDPNLVLEPASLTFTESNWSAAQQVIVSAFEDDDVEDGSDTITLSFAGGGNYESLTQSVPVRIIDSLGEFTLTPTELNLTEGGDSLDMQVRLDVEPVGSSIVTVTLTADRSGLAISPPVFIFPASLWDTPRSVTVRAIDDSNSSDETTTITAVAVGGNYRSVQRTAKVSVQDDDEASIARPPVKAQALAIPPVGAQDSTTLRMRCKQDSPCAVVLDCTAQDDGSTFEVILPESIPAWGTLTLTAEDIERHTGASWAGKGRLGCALRSEGSLGSQVWTRSGDGVLVNNSALIRSMPEGDGHRADIESIPEPKSLERTNLRIRCIAPERSHCTATRLACYDDEGMRYDGDIGTIERLQVRHLQTTEIADRIGYRWQGMGLVCEIRSSAPFTVQVLTRTGGGGALVNNSATGVQ